MTRKILLDGFIIELDGYIIHPGYRGKYQGPWEYSYPSEAPEIEYVKARVIRGSHVKQVSATGMIEALRRRLGSNWEEEMEQED